MCYADLLLCPATVELASNSYRGCMYSIWILLNLRYDMCIGLKLHNVVVVLRTVDDHTSC